METTPAHQKLVARMSTTELERKAQKARQFGVWTQEDLDLARRQAEELMEGIEWE